MKPNAVLVKKVEDTSRYGVVSIKDGLVEEIFEKSKEAKGNMVNTGIYAFSRDIFNLIGEELDIPDVLNKMLVQGGTIVVRETTGTWLDVAYPWDMITLNGAVLRQIKANLGGTIETGAVVKGLVAIGKGTVIRSNSYIVGPVVIGENCDIGPGVCVMLATSIGNNVAISPFTEIENSVIGDDVSIGAGAIIEDSVIDKGCVIKGHFSACSGVTDVNVDNEYHRVNMGAILGVGCNIGSGVVAQPGVIVGNYCQVQGLKVISGRLFDRSLVF
jgi:glucose-1-phosphate thymidylyltransferase